MTLLRRHAPALLVLAGLAAVAALVALDEAAYLRLRLALGPKPFAPFLDLHAVMSAIECHHRGIDVYATNPCDTLGRPHIYSPLWLRLPVQFLLAAWAWRYTRAPRHDTGLRPGRLD